MAARQTLVVCGLLREARCAAGPGITAITSGGRRAVLENRLASLDPSGIDAVVSFGLAGALDPMLSVGAVLLPTEILADGARYAVSTELTAALRAAAGRHGIPFASQGAMAGMDEPAASVAAKAALRARTGAVAVDMESHVAAAWAARHALPFAVLRVISDTADRAIPAAAVAAMGSDGGIDVPAVLKSIARNPGQIPALIGTARDGARAFRVLGRVGGLLGGSV